MDVKEAVRTAKDWVLEVLDDEHPSNLGLEEVEFDDLASQWKITLGFSRPWNSNVGPLAPMVQAQPRSYRTIIIDDRNGEVKGMRRKVSAES